MTAHEPIAARLGSPTLQDRRGSLRRRAGARGALTIASAPRRPAADKRARTMARGCDGILIATSILPRGRRRVAAHRRAEFRRPGRPDRVDAPHPCRGKKVGERSAIPARAEFLHVAAWTRSAAARHLYRLAPARRGGRPRPRGAVLLPPGARAFPPLPALFPAWRAASSRVCFSSRRARSSFSLSAPSMSRMAMLRLSKAPSSA